MLSRTVARSVKSARRVQVACQVAPRAAFSDIVRSELVTELTETPRTRPPNDQLKFGQIMSDHILEVDWNATTEWTAPRITPYHQFALDPAASSLHYALQCFEGMKCYLDDQGRIRLFRPEKNIARLHDSCRRLEFPSFDQEAFLECLKEYLRVEKPWIPEGDGYSLYIRPTAISTHPFLGVAPSSNVKLYTICSPAGPYFAGGFKPVSLYASSENVRAWPGGTGASKLGANYAPTIQPQRTAAAKGYDQVLWLFGQEDGGQVTEVGTMNLFVLWENEQGEEELVTAPLDDLILPGVTRDSVLELARSWGEFKVSERRFSVGELSRAADAGRLKEVFGAGTAVVVCPVRSFHFEGKDYEVPTDPANPGEGAGPLAQRFWTAITDVQYGRKEFEDWSVVVD